MGATPSGLAVGRPRAPPAPQAAEQLERALAAAARALADADVLAVTYGAGFSADSGLAVYADIAKAPS